MSRQLRHGRWSRRGGFLLEVILSLAIFIMVGLAAVSLATNALNAARRSAELRLGLDLARSTLSRIEIGEISPEAAEGPAAAWQGSSSADGDASPGLPGWWIDVQTEPGPLSDLTALTLRVRHDAAPGADGSRGEVIYALQQVVRLGATDLSIGGGD